MFSLESGTSNPNQLRPISASNYNELSSFEVWLKIQLHEIVDMFSRTEIMNSRKDVNLDS